jgi:hypothetical protein
MPAALAHIPIEPHGEALRPGSEYRCRPVTSFEAICAPVEADIAV